ncbi:acylphosphatase [Thaumasiovibrio sp. DFM-14]|uniref:acylphosphatase n=1 Tax=Thaumasiovibrio sp. DFM-14 TaxID=3384792 RepID=UPI0039A2ACC9
MSQCCMKFLVKGRVQGVGFRYHTAHQANKHNITGYARNLPSGDVEVLACGDEQDVRALGKWLQAGPQTSRVDSVTSEMLQRQHLAGFSMH